MKLGMKHQRLKLIIFCSNNKVPCVDLDIFYSKVKFCNLGFYMEKCDKLTMIVSLEIIASCDLEFGLLCKQNDYRVNEGL